jgi:hypothetical protein
VTGCVHSFCGDFLVLISYFPTVHVLIILDRQTAIVR